MEGSGISKLEMIHFLEGLFRFDSGGVSWLSNGELICSFVRFVGTALGEERGRWLRRDVDIRVRLAKLLLFVKEHGDMSVTIDGRKVIDVIQGYFFVLLRWHEEDIRCVENGLGKDEGILDGWELVDGWE
jgi:hypothetical protein